MFAVRSIARHGLFRAEFDGLVARNGGNKSSVYCLTNASL
jgi:hypothetical protein